MSWQVFKKIVFFCLLINADLVFSLDKLDRYLKQNSLLRLSKGDFYDHAYSKRADGMYEPIFFIRRAGDYWKKTTCLEYYECMVFSKGSHVIDELGRHFVLGVRVSKAEYDLSATIASWQAAERILQRYP